MWQAFDNSRTVGTPGSEGGAIVRDEEHELGARITLEQGCEVAPFAITCGLYGWFVHTCYKGGRDEADATYEAMREELGRIADMLGEEPTDAEQTKHAVFEAIPPFVERFPT